jgi:hypothetical protein
LWIDGIINSKEVPVVITCISVGHGPELVTFTNHYSLTLK